MKKEIEFLSKVPIFQKLPKEALKRISSIVETVRFKDGATIFSEGAAGDSLYIVVDGEVSILKTLSKAPSKNAILTSGQMEKIIATLQKGDFFGEMALLDDSKRSATARSKGETVLLKIARETFWHFVKSNAGIALEIILPLARTMSDRLRLTTMELATVYELGKIFCSELNQKELSVQIMEQVRTVLPEDSYFALALWNEFNEEFEWASISDPGTFPAELRRNLSRSEPLPKFLEEKRTHFLSNDWKNDPRFSLEEKKLYGNHEGTILVLPLLKTREAQLLPSGHWITSWPLLGFIFCCAPRKSFAFDKTLIHLLTTISNLSSTALENAAYREEETARNRYAQRRQSTY